MAEKRKVMWIELLRILACFGVIVLHMGAQHFRDIPIDSFNWKVSNFYHGITRFAVSCFMMISGYLYLNEKRELPISKLYKKNIIPVTIAFVFWQCFYAVYRIIVEGRLVIGSGDFFKRIFIYMSKSYFHLWYLPMLIGLLIITPFLRAIVAGEEGKKRAEYLIILYLVFQIIPVTIGYFPLPQKEYVRNVLSIIRPELITSYVGYFVMGYYIGNYEMNKKVEKIIMIMGIALIAIGIILCQYYSLHWNRPTQAFYENYSIAVFFFSSSVFLIFKNYLSKLQLGGKWEKLICQIGSCTFGIYLVHALFRDIFDRFGLDSLTLNPVLGIPLIAILIFICSYALVCIIKKIPIIGKWIV